MKHLLTVLLALASFSIYAKELMVHDAYVRLLPPSSKTTGAFLEIMNHTSKDVKLLKAESDFADKVEIHNHIMKDGMMKMVEVKSIEIKAGKVLAMKPGSYHVMLIGLKKSLKKGQSAKIKLTFDDGTILHAEAQVREISDAKTKGKHHHHHHNH